MRDSFGLALWSNSEGLNPESPCTLYPHTGWSDISHGLSRYEGKGKRKKRREEEKRREEKSGHNKHKWQNPQQSTAAEVLCSPELKLSVRPVKTCLSHVIRISSHPPNHAFYILTYKLSTSLLTSVSNSVWWSCNCQPQPLLRISENHLTQNISALSQCSFGWRSYLI